MNSKYWEIFNQLLDKHFKNESLSIHWICQELKISRMHLHRITKKESGLSTSHYIRQYRLNKAKERLLDKEITISEIAFEVGFNDPNYFSKVFIKTYGVAPSTFRSNCLNLNRTDSGD